MQYWEISVLLAVDNLTLFKLRQTFCSRNWEPSHIQTGEEAIGEARPFPWFRFPSLPRRLSNLYPRAYLAPDLQFCIYNYYWTSFLMFPNNFILHITKRNSLSLTKPAVPSLLHPSSVDGTLSPELSQLETHYHPQPFSLPLLCDIPQSPSPDCWNFFLLVAIHPCPGHHHLQLGPSVQLTNFQPYLLPTYCLHCSRRDSRKANLIISSLIKSFQWLSTEFKIKFKFCTSTYEVHRFGRLC